MLLWHLRPLPQPNGTGLGLLCVYYFIRIRNAILQGGDALRHGYQLQSVVAVSLIRTISVFSYPSFLGIPEGISCIKRETIRTSYLTKSVAAVFCSVPIHYVLDLQGLCTQPQPHDLFPLHWGVGAARDEDKTIDNVR